MVTKGDELFSLLRQSMNIWIFCFDTRYTSARTEVD